MAQIPIALQIFSCRDEAARDLAGVIDQVAEMGYAGVEFAGFYGHTAGEVAKMLEPTGMQVCGSHVKYHEFISEELGRAIEYHKQINCDRMIIPHIPKEKRDRRESCLETAAWLTEMTARLREQGMKTGFHCHADDFEPLDGGQTAWDLFRDHTPDDFIMQFDVGNAMNGGADPVEAIRAIPGRGETLHLKTFAKGTTNETVISEDDEVPWPQVFEAAEQVAGVQWYIVEQGKHPTYSGLEAAQHCLANLRAMGK